MISVGVPGRIQDSVRQISSSGSSVPRGAECMVVSWIVQDLELGWQVPGDNSVRLEGISFLRVHVGPRERGLS